MFLEIMSVDWLSEAHLAINQRLWYRVATNKSPSRLLSVDRECLQFTLLCLPATPSFRSSFNTENPEFANVPQPLLSHCAQRMTFKISFMAVQHTHRIWMHASDGQVLSKAGT